MKVKDNPFQLIANSMIIGASQEGYTLSYSADGETYTEYSEAVPAGENCIVTGFARGTYFKLNGNNTEVEVQY